MIYQVNYTFDGRGYQIIDAKNEHEAEMKLLNGDYILNKVMDAEVLKPISVEYMANTYKKAVGYDSIMYKVR